MADLVTVMFLCSRLCHCRQNTLHRTHAEFLKALLWRVWWKGLTLTTDYSRITIDRGKRDKGCLELPKSSDDTDYNNLEHAITHIVWYTHCVNKYCVYNTVLEYQLYTLVQQNGRTKGRESREAALGAKLQVALMRHWNNLKYGASKLRVSTREGIAPNVIRSLGRRQPCPRPKKVKEYRFQGAPNYIPARRARTSRIDPVQKQNNNNNIYTKKSKPSLLF
jgi:hypothetical protein